MAFIGVAGRDTARDFYKGRLGLRIISADDYALVADVGGVRIAKAPQVQPAGYTVLGFKVPDTREAVGRLARDGLPFERFAFLGDSEGAHGVWVAPGGPRIAWFKDPDGNLLSISDSGTQA